MLGQRNFFLLLKLYLAGTIDDEGYETCVFFIWLLLFIFCILYISGYNWFITVLNLITGLTMWGCGTWLFSLVID